MTGEGARAFLSFPGEVGASDLRLEISPLLFHTAGFCPTPRYLLSYPHREVLLMIQTRPFLLHHGDCMFVFASSKALRGWFVVDFTLLDLAISDHA